MESESKKYVEQFESYFCNDEAVPYKDLLIHPVRTRNYYDFFIASNILCINKNEIPDPKIISMSYLDFIFHLMDNDSEGQLYKYMFIQIMCMCLKIEPSDIEYRLNDKNKIELFITVTDNGISKEEFVEQCINKDSLNSIEEYGLDIFDLLENKDAEIISKLCKISIASSLKLIKSYNNCVVKSNKIMLDKNDFDNIRYIILYQNIPDYDDEYIDPNVKKVLDEALAFKNRNKAKMCDFEEQKVCVNIINGMRFEDIDNITLRKFSKIIEFANKKINYEIAKTGEMSGMVTFKEEIHHWMTKTKSDKYSEVLTDFGEFSNKIKQANQ